MKQSLLHDICCPLCHGELQLAAPVAAGPVITDGSVIVDGMLRCAQCGEEYAVQDRMPNLIPTQHIELRKVNEMKGWVDLWEEKGMYAHPTLEHSFVLPYLGGIWEGVARMFDMAMQEMKLTGDEVILDLGAGQGWASRYFAEKGCRAIALDIVADKSYGLGRSWAIMDHAGVYFEPLLGDGENLPFPDARFDIVFFCGALHHFPNRSRILSQVQRVLKPGGRVIAAGEPSIPVFVKETAVQDTLEEVQFGIVECRPKSFEYERELRRAGFSQVTMDTYETYGASAQQIRQWIREVRRHLFKVVRPRYKPLAWLVLTGTLALPARLAARLVLYINGGNLFLTGVK